jgi:serine/threonine protein kinase
MELVKHKMGTTMILNELEAMKRLDHPAIINLHFAFHDKKRCFFVLDLKTGGDLRYYLRKRYVFEEYDVAFYIAAISSALDHIHSKNIIHRDIKPENIILDERGYPYLTDFGVSHVQEQSTVPTTLTSTLASGTKQYLAPEVFTKTHVHGPEMDFWALGVVAYELLFGRRPFEKHCPIAFISYLEKAMTLKRRQQKEAKLRHLSSLFVNNSANNDDSNTISASREFSKTSLLRDSYGSLSPSQSLEISSPVTSSNKRCGGALSKSIESKANGLIPMKSGSMNSNSCMQPLAQTANSTELGSRSQDSRDMQFCSSVGVTNASGYFSYDNSGFSTPKKPLIDSSPAATKYAIGYDHRNGSSSQPPSPQATSAVAGSGKSSHCLLPDLKPPSRSQSPPKSLFASNNSSPSSSLKRSSNKFGQRQPPIWNGIAGTDTEDYGDILPGGDVFDIGGLVKQSENLVIYEENDEGDEEFHEQTSPAKFIRATPGDHWLVDDGILHPSLYVDIPDSTSWLGPISLDCQRVLAGFFEVRPNHRLGARNMAALKRCRWFEKLKITDWEDLLQTKRFEPRFQPGKRFIRECLDRMDDVGEAKVLGCDESTNDGSNSNMADLDSQPLTTEEEEAFDSFYHVAPHHHDLFYHSVTTNSVSSSSTSFSSLHSSKEGPVTARKMSHSSNIPQNSAAKIN